MIIITEKSLEKANDYNILCFNDNNYTRYSYLSGLVVANECLVYKISRGLMGYGGVEYTYKYTPFCINMRRILLRKSCVVQ